MGQYSMGDALKHFLRHSRMKGYLQALQIEDVWEQIMGKTIAKYTDKIQIQGKTLFITTSMAPLKQELLYQKETIVKRVNEVLGENVVQDVVIN
jgi:predicted nucleic acid-binding Zn ribbon protein